MSISGFYPIFLSLLLLFTSCYKKEDRETARITEKSISYKNAYNSKDAKALSLLWAEDAEYIVPDSGKVLKGRDAIQKFFQDRFQNEEDTQISIMVRSIKFENPDLAEALGTVIIEKEGKITKRRVYRAFYVKQNGDWLLKKAREAEINIPTQSVYLKNFEWLVGNWIDEDEDVEIISDIKWEKYKNFLTEHFTVFVQGTFEREGWRFIGYDPITESVRSWIFYSDGTFGEGRWDKKGITFIEEVSQTLPDGKRAFSVNIYTPVDQNSFTVKSIRRQRGGKLLPDVGPVTIVRRKEVTAPSPEVEGL